MTAIHLTLVCQCVSPCLAPFREETGAVSLVGCLRPKEHEGGHSLDGTHEFTYREQPLAVGPRMVMRQEQPGGLFRATCWRCKREYALGAVMLGEEAADEVTQPSSMRAP